MDQIRGCPGPWWESSERSGVPAYQTMSWPFRWDRSMLTRVFSNLPAVAKVWFGRYLVQRHLWPLQYIAYDWQKDKPFYIYDFFTVFITRTSGYNKCRACLIKTVESVTGIDGKMSNFVHIYIAVVLFGSPLSCKLRNLYPRATTTGCRSPPPFLFV